MGRSLLRTTATWVDDLQRKVSKNTYPLSSKDTYLLIILQWIDEIFNVLFLKRLQAANIRKY